VLVQRRGKAGDAPLAVIKRLVKRTPAKVTLEQFTPPRPSTSRHQTWCRYIEWLDRAKHN
jgi:hypothetical protein